MNSEGCRVGNGINGNRVMKRDVGFCLRFHCLFAENACVRMMSLLPLKDVLQAEEIIKFQLIAGA